MHVCTSRDTKMCFLSRSWYEFILLSFLPLPENGSTSENEGKEPFTAFACLFNSRVSSREFEMNEWNQQKLVFWSERRKRRKQSWRKEREHLILIAGNACRLSRITITHRLPYLSLKKCEDLPSEIGLKGGEEWKKLFLFLFVRISDVNAKQTC